MTFPLRIRVLAGPNAGSQDIEIERIAQNSPPPPRLLYQDIYISFHVPETGLWQPFGGW